MEPIRLKPINDAIYSKIERILENYGVEGNCTIDVVDEEVEGLKEGVGLIVGSLNGTIEINNYYESGGDYWEPAYCEYDAHVDCEFSYSDEDENEHSETITYYF